MFSCSVNVHQYSSGRLRSDWQSTPNASTPECHHLRQTPLSRGAAITSRSQCFRIRSIQTELVPGKFSANKQDEWHITHPTGCKETHAGGTCVTQLAHFNNLLISDVEKTQPRSELYSQGKIHVQTVLVLKPYKYEYSYTSTYITITR